MLIVPNARSVPWTRQPTTLPQVNRALAESLDLRAAWYPAGERFIDALDGVDAASFTTTNSVATGRSGKAVRFAAGNVLFDSKERYNTLSPKGMAIVAVVSPTNAGNYAGVLFNQQTTTTNGPYELRLSTGAVDYRTYFLRSNAASYRAWAPSGSAFTTNDRDYVVGVSVESNLIETPPVLCIDGGFITMADAGGGGTGAVTAPPAGTSVRLSQRYDGAVGLNGRIYGIFLFGRGLSRGWLARLTRNPWQLFV